MKVSEIRGLSEVELKKRLDDLKDELFNLRFRAVTGQLDTPAHQKLESIARVQTVLRERELHIS